MFAAEERKMEAVEYMSEIIQAKMKLAALIQWVKAIYAVDLMGQ